MTTHLRSMTAAELAQVLKELGQPAFRAKQLFTWLHRGAASYEEMTNLPKALRDKLQEHYPLYPPRVVRKQESQKDGTIKYLWELSNGNCVETVLMRYHYGNTVCISTEVGCRMGCAFCASTLGGLVRRLEPREMLTDLQNQGNWTKLMVMLEEEKTMPFGEIWDEYCRVCQKPVDGQWFPEVEKYEHEIQLKRG